MEEASDSGLTRRWERIREVLNLAFTNSSEVRISFVDKVNAHPEGWSAHFTGRIVDVGQDGTGSWVDIRLQSHTLWHHDVIDSLFETDKIMREQEKLPAGSTAWSDDDVKRWIDAQALNDSVQEVIGNMRELTVPDEVTRFYMSQIGHWPLILVIGQN